jgi:hypothetical protein
MFFISWGSRVLQRIFGAPEQHHCDICREERTFRKMVTYKVFHIWWIFRWVVESNYARICVVCRNGSRIDKKDVVTIGAKSPIPFFDRMGWSFGVGGLGALAVMGSVASAAQGQREATWLDRPAVNDVYEVDLTKLVKTPEASQMYSALEVVRVSGDAVDVRVPKGYFKSLGGVSAAVSDGRARSPDFYEDRIATYSVAALHRMKQDGVIVSVER